MLSYTMLGSVIYNTWWQGGYLLGIVLSSLSHQCHVRVFITSQYLGHFLALDIIMLLINKSTSIDGINRKKELSKKEGMKNTEQYQAMLYMVLPLYTHEINTSPNIHVGFKNTNVTFRTHCTVDNNEQNSVNCPVHIK